MTSADARKLLFESPESRTASPFNITSVCIDWHNDFGVSHVNCEHMDIDTMNKNDYSFGSRICSSEVLPTKSQSSLLENVKAKWKLIGHRFHKVKRKHKL